MSYDWKLNFVSDANDSHSECLNFCDSLSMHLKYVRCLDNRKFFVSKKQLKFEKE